MTPFPSPCAFSFSVLFSGCTLSLLLYRVRFQVALSYVFPAIVIHQGASRHLLGLSLNANSLVMSSLATLSKVSYLYWNYSVSQHPLGFFLHRAYIYSVPCVLAPYRSLSYHCKTCATNLARPLEIWHGHCTQVAFPLIAGQRKQGRQTSLQQNSKVQSTSQGTQQLS